MYVNAYVLLSVGWRICCAERCLKLCNCECVNECGFVNLYAGVSECL